MSREKTFIDSISLRELVARQVGELCGTAFSVFVVDEEYYCPPLGDVERILGEAKVSEREYRAESDDCDDFAFVAKDAFIEDAYREGARRPAYCFGLCFSLGHAFNWFVGDDLVLRFVEPQTGEVYGVEGFPPKDMLTFMLV